MNQSRPSRFLTLNQEWRGVNPLLVCPHAAPPLTRGNRSGNDWTGLQRAGHKNRWRTGPLVFRFQGRKRTRAASILCTVRNVRYRARRFRQRGYAPHSAITRHCVTHHQPQSERNFLCSHVSVTRRFSKLYRGKGWRVLIQWDPAAADAAEGFPAATLEPVIAWVTLKVPRIGAKCTYDDVVIAPLVRFPSGDELLILDSDGPSSRKVVYLAPGEEVNEQHVNQLRHGGYATGVTLV